LREAARARAAARPAGPDLPFVEQRQTDAGLPLRLYRPDREPRPLVLYLHGGGFVLGDLDSHDAICRWLAQIADVVVLAVDYRRAPEHPGPAAVDDAVSGFGWAMTHLDELGADPLAGIALAGDSSGGALALLAAVDLRRQLTIPSALLLVCPNTDMTLSNPSVQQEGHGWGLETDDLRWFVEQWVPDPRRRDDPEVSPLHANLAGLPPALIVTAEHDPLRDEGDALAEALRDAGVQVHHVPLAGLVHGFIGLGQVSPAAALASHTVFEQFGALVRQTPPEVAAS
jgi:acetyl esterase